MNTNTRQNARTVALDYARHELDRDDATVVGSVADPAFEGVWLVLVAFMDGDVREEVAILVSVDDEDGVVLGEYDAFSYFQNNGTRDDGSYMNVPNVYGKAVWGRN